MHALMNSPTASSLNGPPATPGGELPPPVQPPVANLDFMNKFLAILLDDALQISFFSNRGAEYVNSTTPQEIMERNQNMSEKWLKVANYNEFRNSSFKLPQVILYDRCLKYMELKVMCNKLDDKDYFVHIKNTEQVSLYRINYHREHGRMTMLCEFVTKNLFFINQLDLFKLEDYKLLLKMFNSHCKVKHSDSFNDILKAIPSDVAKNFNDTLGAIGLELKKDYDEFHREINNINKILSVTVTKEEARSLINHRMMIASVCATLVSCVIALMTFLHVYKLI